MATSHTSQKKLNQVLCHQYYPSSGVSFLFELLVIFLIAKKMMLSKLLQLLEDSLEERLEKAGGLVPDSEKVDGETRDGETEENKVR